MGEIKARGNYVLLKIGIVNERGILVYN